MQSRLLWLVVLAAGCHSDLNRHTHAFVAPSACGQGPYEVTLRAEGLTGGDGVEVVACTPRRLAGHVVVYAGEIELANQHYGDVADNQRCLGGAPVIVASAGAGSTTATARDGTTSGGTTAGAPALIERPFTQSETPFADELCRGIGMGQTILMPTVLENTQRGRTFTMRVKLWSDTPNDLDGVVFMVRQLTSRDTPEQVAKEEAKRDKRHDAVRPPSPPRPVEHGPPPAPLVEERPPQPVAIATWVPGYWTWTGAQWGWIAGFWRDERYTAPAPRVEVPGEPPNAGAIWIGGAWTLRATGYVWIGGRWRR